jgi:CDP-glucose 4,6-dehydratase
VTGHTGFKGSWLCEWLLGLGAEVWGYSLPPPTRPALFDQLGLSKRIHHIVGDVRNPETLHRALRASKADFVFHLAAQPIVRAAHGNPTETWSTNVMGTVNLLEALRALGRPCATVIVTTDKVYGGGPQAHREIHPLGGHEPYGASKAATELAVQAWREAFGLRAIATARAGNVIGGGDWASDRLVPDCIRALKTGRAIKVRNPSSIRPWQHVLDPLHGYLILGARLKAVLGSRSKARCELEGAFNFGPRPNDHRRVVELVSEVLGHWPGKWTPVARKGAPKEAPVLRLDARKAMRVLGWSPQWHFPKAVARTVAWFRGARSPETAQELTRNQIAEFSKDLP